MKIPCIAPVMTTNIGVSSLLQSTSSLSALELHRGPSVSRSLPCSPFEKPHVCKLRASSAAARGVEACYFFSRGSRIPPFFVPSSVVASNSVLSEEEFKGLGGSKVSSMSEEKQPASYCKIFIHKRHYRHQTAERPPTLQPPSLQCQSQAHQHLPLLLQPPSLQYQSEALQPPTPLLQRHHHLRPAPSTADHNRISSMSNSNNQPSPATASDVLRLMDALRLPIEADIYASLLQDCARSGDILQGATVHAHIRRQFPASRSLLRLPTGLALSNRLLFMYAACGQPAVARQVFGQMPFRDSISRIITMTALSGMEALRLFESMHAGREDWWAADPLGFSVVLRACTRARELGLGRQLHGLAIKFTGCSSFLEHSAPLINFYAMLGCPDLALQLMLASPCSCKEVACWARIVWAYSRGGLFRKSLLAFREMEARTRGAGSYPKSKMLATVVAACAAAGEGNESHQGGRQVHAHAVKVGVDDHPYVGCSLVELYSKRGLLVEARRAFETVGVAERDAACWNAMLGGYARGGSPAEAFLFLRELKAAGIKPHASYVNDIL